MKKLFVILSVMILIMSFVGCKNEEAEVTDPTVLIPNTPANPFSPNPDEVSITIPIYGELSEEEIMDLKADNGYNEVIINDNGSMTITMSSENAAELKELLKIELDSFFAAIESGAEGAEYIQDVQYELDYTEITLKVDKTLYEELLFEDVFYDVFGITVVYHFQLYGLDQTCHFVVMDYKTDEVLFNRIYPDDLYKK